MCILAVASAMKGKPGKPGKGGKGGKAIRALNGLCSAYESGVADVNDASFDDVFSDDVFGDFCDDFFAAQNKTAMNVTRSVDAVKALAKVCKGFAKRPAPEDGPLAGVDAVCDAAMTAKAMSMGDKKSKKALKGLVGICTALAADTLVVKVSNFTEVFEAMDEDFCPEFLNSTLVVSERRKKGKDAVRVMGDACRWYAKKFAEVEPEGVLAELDDICEDYNEIKMALEEEEEEDSETEPEPEES